MDKFWKEIAEGDIRFRDNLQFELKSDFTPVPNLSNNAHTQEFYLFIPNVLQVNSNTYSKKQFYRDQTNLIRYKTPEFTFEELLDPENPLSPLARIYELITKPHSMENVEIIQDEVKLLGNIVRSALRKSVNELIDKLNNPSVNNEEWSHEISAYQKDVYRFFEMFQPLQENFSQTWTHPLLLKHFHYVNDFISDSIDYYTTGLLDELRTSEHEDLKSADANLCSILIQERERREKKSLEPKGNVEDTMENEYILYRKGLLNQFVLDALLLTVKRKANLQKYAHFIGSFAAGLAMLVYLILFIWQGEVFVINSIPFVIITTFLYILKDRMKEGIKTLYQRKAFKWFPDYTTEIRTPDGKTAIGKLTESFTWVDEDKIPKNIRDTRDQQFHTVLETFRRHEKVIYYKKRMILKNCSAKNHARRLGLNTIFRFNIHEFLHKASNAFSSYASLNQDNLLIGEKRLPKVYHLNMIMVNRFFDKDLKEQCELKKFRLIIDKNGIKRVEHLRDGIHSLGLYRKSYGFNSPLL
ncbi:MAG: hypothetical protein ACI9S8_000470 [Chlamydiales bacterium]|jgi:hypothetical protein